MDVMRILKIVFVVALCVPVAYIGYLLFGQLTDQLVKQSSRIVKKKKRTDTK